MKKALRLLFCLVLGFAGVAQARTFSQPELDALLAPIALYPDPVLSNVLDAAQYPDQVREAAAWTRDNPQLKGDEAMRALGPVQWPQSVKALAAFPDVLARMDESPQWLQDLGDAYRAHGPYVMDTVQQLRRRAQSNGNLQSNDQQRVYEDNGAVIVQPVYPQVVYVPYYDPFVVYGAWWWPAYRPVVFRPWPVFGVHISFGFFAARCDWHARQVVVVSHPVPTHVWGHGGGSHPVSAHGGGFVPHSPPTQWRSGPSQTPRTGHNDAPAPRRQVQAQSHYQQPAVRSMAPTNWRPAPQARPVSQARSMPQAHSTGGAGRTMGGGMRASGMHGGRRG
jgi:hypothetical protein